MQSLVYFIREAFASLWRGRRAAALASLTMASSLFVFGIFVAIESNLRRTMMSWSESTGISIYLADDVTQAQLRDLDLAAERSGMVAHRRYVSRGALPASVELELAPSEGVTRSVKGFAAAIAAMPGVIEVRYDLQWLGRLDAMIRAARVIRTAVMVVLALAAALTIAGVVRLAIAARHDEIEVMQLVGAPLACIRGPFVVEGLLQGMLGGLIAVTAMAAVNFVVRAKDPAITVLPLRTGLLILAAGSLLGAAGGYLATRRLR